MAPLMTGFDVAIQRNSHRPSESQIRTKLNLAAIIKFPFKSSKCDCHRFTLFSTSFLRLTMTIVNFKRMSLLSFIKTVPLRREAVAKTTSVDAPS